MIRRPRWATEVSGLTSVAAPPPILRRPPCLRSWGVGGGPPYFATPTLSEVVGCGGWVPTILRQPQSELVGGRRLIGTPWWATEVLSGCAPRPYFATVVCGRGVWRDATPYFAAPLSEVAGLGGGVPTTIFCGATAQTLHKCIARTGPYTYTTKHC